VRKKDHVNKTSSLTRIFFAALVWSLVMGCGAEPPTHGREVVRLASLAPSLTDIVEQLGAGDLLVGISRFCRRPPSSRAKIVGSMIDAQTEELSALSPTHLLFVGPQTQFQDIVRLSPGTKLERFEMSTLEDIRSSVQRLAAIVERSAKGQELIARLDLDIAQARQSLAHKSLPRVMFVLDSSSHGRLVAGPGTYLDDIMTALGLTNAASELPGQTPWRSADTEAVLAARPHLLIVKPDGQSQEQAQQAKERWLRFVGQPKIELREVRVTQEAEWTIPSTRLGSVAKTLAELANDLGSPKP
jgi:ABC-type hemin transport system substrate-binding protein